MDTKEGFFIPESCETPGIEVLYVLFQEEASRETSGNSDELSSRVDWEI